MRVSAVRLRPRPPTTIDTPPRRRDREESGHGVRVRIRGEQVEVSIGEERALLDVRHICDDVTRLVRTLEERRAAVERRRHETMMKEI